MLSIYRSVMDANVNPLMSLPLAQRFQIMMFLSIMWTTIFCAAGGMWFWYGELVIAHMLLTLAFVVTGLTFHRANRAVTYRDQPLQDGTARYDRAVTYRDQPLQDGTARYDDVWGA